MSILNNNKIIISGTVQSGQGMGKELKAATANLDPSLGNGLKDGLYQCRVLWRWQNMSGLIYYGMNFLSQQKCLEVHIIDFDEMIVGQEIKIEIGKYLRPPVKFKNSEEAKITIAKDLEQAKNI